MTTEAEIRMMHLQTKERQGLSRNHQTLEEAGRTIPWSLQRGHGPATPGSSPSGLQTWKEINPIGLGFFL